MADFSLIAGPYIAAALNCTRYDLQTAIPSATKVMTPVVFGTNAMDDYVKNDYGLNVGISLQYTKILYGLNYGVGFKNISPKVDVYAYNRSVSLYAAFMFGKQKRYRR